MHLAGPASVGGDESSVTFQLPIADGQFEEGSGDRPEKPGGG